LKSRKSFLILITLAEAAVIILKLEFLKIAGGFIKSLSTGFFGKYDKTDARASAYGFVPALSTFC
jgi:hypothetical protein